MCVTSDAKQASMQFRASGTTKPRAEHLPVRSGLMTQLWNALVPKTCPVFPTPRLVLLRYLIQKLAMFRIRPTKRSIHTNY